ncbi:unnamed protein product [Blepharisma stoltei]|uniref:Uncharacterized protein n=1 Tax=Blepharisma stoltei TaxID=1481888 RepID=A0AAU9JKE2_9CILI|nr:unnamed protein product [Blepharisma stoltei]
MSLTNRQITGKLSRKSDEFYLKFQIAKAEVNELKESLRFVEYRLAKTESENKTIKDAMESLLEEISEKSSKLEQEHEKTLALEKEIKNLECELGKARETKLNENKEWSKKILNLNVEENKLCQEISSLKECLEMANEEIAALKDAKEKTKEKLKSILKSQSDQSFVEKEIEDTEREPVQTYEYVKQIPILQQEIKRLYKDNCKLFEIIKSGKSLAHINSLVQDSNGITYHQDKGNCGKKRCAANNSNEDSDWIPISVYNVMKEFKDGKNLTASVISQLLTKVCHLWSERECNRIKRLKQKYEHKLEEMKAKLMASQPQSPASHRSSGHKRSYSYKDSNSEIRIEIQELIRKAYGNLSNNVMLAIRQAFGLSPSLKNKQREEELSDVVLKMVGDYTEVIVSYFF